MSVYVFAYVAHFIVFYSSVVISLILLVLMMIFLLTFVIYISQSPFFTLPSIPFHWLKNNERTEKNKHTHTVNKYVGI